ncbi:hypothetical protein [Nonomuraea endophytica]|uniref:Uncharacterized protein n=1 Tax=Nonomuraea endophytica TaxID=714136 RepID=A0A7W8AAT2_9ACTN|nr:hypothetical protein [Nonomuraea endophytica]MBB5081393.1 hypothetical protein [Nonomuraea endophytica]
MRIRLRTQSTEELFRVRENAIDEARTRANNLALYLARARARDFRDNHDYVRARVLARARDLARNLARDLARDPVLARNRDPYFDRPPVLPRDPARARTLAHDLARARDLARNQERFHSIGRSHGIVRSRDLGRATKEAQRIMSCLDTAAQLDAKLQVQRTSRIAGLLIELNVLLLPCQHRTRYRREFQAELRNLSDAEADRRSRVMYAVRQLSHVWALRASLLAPGEPRIFRSYRLACWILRSEWRTWGLLGPLMALAAVNVFLQQGWGSIFWALPGVVTFYASVEWLRKRWGVSVKRRSQTGSSSSE